ncbi:MAG TPA: nucleotidyl transferase AbiEii/AbiGii toxin family protein [Geminicoccaceae bacterium]|nr:nucleotidyl transferase AbiEii/AbiGii toxin family protein [Geminicoccaceae bacterium]
MTGPPLEEPWQPLLDAALAVLATLGPQVRWSWGGGTALALSLGHRASIDVDIFLPDATALRALSPQRNPTVRALTSRWQEPGHYLKLELEQGEVDFISAPLLTGPGTVAWPYRGRDLPLETVAEVLAKKLHWRGSRVLARDVFDLEAARRLDPAGFVQAIAAVPEGARRVADQIRRGLPRLKRELPLAVRPLPAGEPLLRADLLALASDLEVGASTPLA